MIPSTAGKLSFWAGAGLLCLALVLSACSPQATQASASKWEFPPRTYRQWIGLWQDECGEGRARIRALLSSRPLRSREIEVLLARGRDAADVDAWDMVRLNLQHHDVYPAILSLSERLPLNALPNLLPSTRIQAGWLERAILSCPGMQSRAATDLCTFHGAGYLRVLTTLAARGTPATVDTIYMNAGLELSNVKADLELSKAIIRRADTPALRQRLRGCGRVLGAELLKKSKERQLASFLANLPESQHRSLILKAVSVADYVSSVRRLQKALNHKKKRR